MATPTTPSSRTASPGSSTFSWKRRGRNSTSDDNDSSAVTSMTDGEFPNPSPRGGGKGTTPNPPTTNSVSLPDNWILVEIRDICGVLNKNKRLPTLRRHGRRSITDVNDHKGSKLYQLMEGNIPWSIDTLHEVFDNSPLDPDHKGFFTSRRESWCVPDKDGYVSVQVVLLPFGITAGRYWENRKSSTSTTLKPSVSKETETLQWNEAASKSNDELNSGLPRFETSESAIRYSRLFERQWPPAELLARRRYPSAWRFPRFIEPGMPEFDKLESLGMVKEVRIHVGWTGVSVLAFLQQLFRNLNRTLKLRYERQVRWSTSVDNLNPVDEFEQDIDIDTGALLTTLSRGLNQPVIPLCQTGWKSVNTAKTGHSGKTDEVKPVLGFLDQLNLLDADCWTGEWLLGQAVKVGPNKKPTLYFTTPPGYTQFLDTWWAGASS